MNGFITQDSLARLHDSIDIIDLISSYIDVKKVGINYMALCPFHNERTPSMSISQSKGLYYCHACGASGDAIAFVMEHERLDFIEAVEKIARFFNVSLEYENNGKNKDKGNHTKDILLMSANFYHNNLFRHNEILDYLYKRGVSLDSIKLFKVGYSGLSYESISFLDRNNIGHKDAIECGILCIGAERNYARFTNRIMFPIHSKSGMIVGFGGRSLDINSTAKYLNSPQSRLFNKSKILYGYHIARPAIHAQNSIIICEGYLDVIMLHQNGFKNVAGTLGTAFNKEHLSVLSRDDPKIFMCYDGDKAGINAAFKAAKLLSQNSKDGGVLILQNGLDPADMMAEGKIEEFKRNLLEAKGFVEFALEHITSQFSLNNPVQKESALRECIEFLHTLSPVLQDSYKSKCATLLGVNPAYIKTKTSKGKHVDIAHFRNLALQDSQNNSGEELILINMLENSEHFFFALNFLDKKYFEVYGEEFELIVQDRIDDKRVVALRVKSKAKVLKHDEFKQKVSELIRLYATRLLKKIRITGIIDSKKSWEQKRNVVLALENSIKRLKNGEIFKIYGFDL